MEFKVTVLPDDPRLTPSATRKRQIRNSKAWRRARFTPRAINGRHANHPLTYVENHDIRVPKGW